MSSLKELQAQFEKADKKQTNESSGGSNYYPFWDMKQNEEAVLRFMEDGNKNNPLKFLVEKITHTLQVGDKRHVVPCLKEYGEKCPVCEVSQKFYNANDKVNGSKYWRKKQHLAQVLVMQDPLPPDENGETHQGKLRYLSLGFQIYNVIKETFSRGDLDEVPYAIRGGTDFIIKKGEQGGHANYQLGSRFARKSSDVPEDVLATLDLVDLSTLLPPKPDVDRIRSLLEQSLNGAEEAPVAVSSAPISREPAAKADVKAEQKVEKAAPTADPSATAAAILAKIRSRQANTATA